MDWGNNEKLERYRVKYRNPKIDSDEFDSDKDNFSITKIVRARNRAHARRILLSKYGIEEWEIIKITDLEWWQLF